MTIAGTSHRIYGTAFGGTAPENYERYFVPAIGAPFARDLVASAALRPGERVLDVACGTGIVARLAAERVGPGGSVAGADVNAGMLSVARRAAEAIRPPIQWYETSAEAMPLPDGRFDAVFCQFGLQFMADQPAALREMRRVLAPGGRAAISVPTPTRFFDVLDRALERHDLPEAAAFMRRVFSVNDPGELERLCRAAGFATVEVTPHTKRLLLPGPREFLWQYIESTPAGAAVSQLDDERRAAFEQDVVTEWQEWTKGTGMEHAPPVLIAATRA